MAAAFVAPTIAVAPCRRHGACGRRRGRLPPSALPSRFWRAAATPIPHPPSPLPPRATLSGVGPVPTAERQALLDAVAAVGPDRGIFGLDSDTRASIDALAAAVEVASPVAAPIARLDDLLNGRWRLLYTTLTILGRRRSRLSLSTASKPGFVSLGELYQNVDAATGVAESVVQFRVMGRVEGAFAITASFTPQSDRRVGVAATGSSLTPPGLEKMLGENVGLLTQIFDPTGWLDVTYLDGGADAAARPPPWIPLSSAASSAPASRRYGRRGTTTHPAGGCPGRRPARAPFPAPRRRRRGVLGEWAAAVTDVQCQ